MGFLKKQIAKTITTTSTREPQTLPTMIFTLFLHHVVSHAAVGTTGVTGVGKVLLSMFLVGVPVGYGGFVVPALSDMSGFKITAYTPVDVSGILTQLSTTMMFLETQISYYLLFTVARQTSDTNSIESALFILNSIIAPF